MANLWRMFHSVTALGRSLPSLKYTTSSMVTTSSYLGGFCDVVAGTASQGALRHCVECTGGELCHVSSMLAHLS